MRTRKVPKVNLLDVNVEPTDEELEALMQDMIDIVIEKHDKAHKNYMNELFAGIDKAAAEGLEKARQRRLKQCE